MLTSSSGDPLRLALVAHDAKKESLIDFVVGHAKSFQSALLFATGTTGSKLLCAVPSLSLSLLKSGPLGGDQQIGALICEGGLDGLFFFVDPLTPMPHDVDVKALTRLAVVYDIPLANSLSTAELLIFAMRSRYHVV